MGSETNTGPDGGAAASWKARRMIVPSSSTLRTSCTHFADRASEAHEIAGEQGVGDDVALVLLPGGHDERRAVRLRRW